MTTSVFFGVFYVLTNALQAMGAAFPSFIINLSRQGIIYIPALYLLNSLLGANGLIWAQPVADVLSIGLAAVLYGKTAKEMMKGNDREAKEDYEKLNGELNFGEELVNENFLFLK